VDLVHFGLPDDYYETFGGESARAEDERPERCGEDGGASGQYDLVVVGDRAKIEAGVKELKPGRSAHDGRGRQGAERRLGLRRSACAQNVC